VRVLFVEFSQGFGGSAKSLSTLIDGLPLDVEPLLVVPYDLSRYLTLSPRLKLLILDVPDQKLGYTRRSHLAWYSHHFRFWIRRLNQVVAEFHPDLIHSNNGLMTNAPAGFIGRWHRIPVISHQRHALHKGVIERSVARLGLFDRYLAISDWVHQSLLELGVPTLRIQTIHNPVAPPPRELKRPPPDDERPLVIGSFSMLMPWKGLDVLLKAVALTASRTQKPFKLLIVGEEPLGETEYLDRLKALARELGITSIVEFLGRLEDVYSIMIKTDIAVHSSVLPEPFGRVIPEAMMCGAAVIATEGGGTSESMFHEETGLLVPRRDVEAMALALERLVNDSELRTRLGTRGRQLALERFAGQTNIQKVYGVYRELLKQPACARGA